MKTLIESPLFELLNGNVLPAALVDSVIKGLVLLALLGLVAFALRKASASVRHGIWLGGLMGVLVLPLLTMSLPGWCILPDAWSPTVEVPKTDTVASLKSGDAAIGKSEDVAMDPTISPSSIELEDPAPAAAPVVSHAVIGVDKHVTPNHKILSTRQWIALIWVAGAALLAARLLVSRWGLGRLARRTRRVTGGYLEDELREQCARLGIRRRVVLLLSRQRAIPMTWGILRPRILLPSEMANWKPEKRRAVLLHELAHVARWDCLSQLIGQIALVFHWFNPLVWVAVRRLAIEQEHACDDRVLGNGVDPPDYAELILNLSAAFPVPRFWGATAGANAMAMAKPAGLEKRLRGILSPDRNRRSPGLGAVIAGVGCLALILCPLAMIEAGDKKGKRPAPDRPNPDPVLIDGDTEIVTTERESAVTSTEKVRSLSDGRSGVAIFGRGDAVFEVPLNREGSLRVRFPDAEIRHPNPNGEESDRIHLRSGEQGETVFLTVDDRGRGASVMVGGVVRGDSDSILVEDRRRSEGKVELVHWLDQLRQAVAPHVSNPSSLQIDLTDRDGGDIEDVLELLRNPRPKDGLDQLYRELAEELAQISKRLDKAQAEADNEMPRVFGGFRIRETIGNVSTLGTTATMSRAGRTRTTLSTSSRWNNSPAMPGLRTPVSAAEDWRRRIRSTGCPFPWPESSGMRRSIHGRKFPRDRCCFGWTIGVPETIS